MHFFYNVQIIIDAFYISSDTRESFFVIYLLQRWYSRQNFKKAVKNIFAVIMQQRLLIGIFSPTTL